MARRTQKSLPVDKYNGYSDSDSDSNPNHVWPVLPSASYLPRSMKYNANNALCGYRQSLPVNKFCGYSDSSRPVRIGPNLPIPSYLPRSVEYGGDTRCRYQQRYPVHESYGDSDDDSEDNSEDDSDDDSEDNSEDDSEDNSEDDSEDDSSSDQLPVASSHRRSVKYDDTLCEDMQRLGLNKHKKGYTVKTYSVSTLKESLRSEEWMTNPAPYMELEDEVIADFKHLNGQSKICFTYLLLDPRMTNNLPAMAKQGGLTKLQKWKTFVKSIFYIGKGTRNRPFDHLKEAKNDSTTEKTQRILDIWQNNLGVVCLNVFHNVISEEAHTNEAAMIDVIGVPSLTNSVSGTYYGVAKSWPPEKQRMFGLYLLYKAMDIFINEGEKQLGPDDI